MGKLPVYVVIRLCTNEKAVIKYWDDIDGQLELDIDVLDDLIGESEQVAAHNSWLTYSMHIHRSDGPHPLPPSSSH